MPPHDTYIETHFGGGAIMYKKPWAARSIAIDIDAAVFEALEHSHFEIHAGDCVEYLAGFDFASAGRVLIYADPPYLLSTRSGKNRYRFDYSETDHARLIRQLCLCPPAVKYILSGYPSRLYDELLPSARTIEFQTMTRGGVRTEKLWLNFPAGPSFCNDFAGDNFTDRQRIKRKVERWKRKFYNLPPAERAAILAGLLDPA